MGVVKIAVDMSWLSDSQTWQLWERESLGTRVCFFIVFDFVPFQMTMEIEIHRSLSHNHVVGFYGFFEDRNHVYILLELCRRRSLMELHKRRKALTEPEVRYYLNQILLAVKYLHDEKVSILYFVLKVTGLYGY